jgi:hypothetical protein
MMIMIIATEDRDMTTMESIVEVGMVVSKGVVISVAVAMVSARLITS